MSQHEDKPSKSSPQPDQGARLYLVTPGRFSPDEFARQLGDLAGEADIASLLVVLDDAAADVWMKAVDTILPVAHRHDIAVIVHGRTDIALKTGADGAHVEGSAAMVEQAVAKMKPDRIVGVGGTKSRHDAMTVGEMGADYILFGAACGRGDDDPDLVESRIAWWSEVFEVPCVGYAGRLEQVPGLVAAGADFVALGPALWQAGDGPAAALRALRPHLGADRVGAAR